MPGIGPISGARLFAATGGSPDDFPTPGRPAALAGAAPAPMDPARASDSLHRPQ
ncbi:transposase [Streptomyces roseus]|uniref:transposase n=1 Tax=Streptomyces roseus TaxID=66430 RepID=UPI00369B9ABD